MYCIISFVSYIKLEIKPYFFFFSPSKKSIYNIFDTNPAMSLVNDPKSTHFFFFKEMNFFSFKKIITVRISPHISITEMTSKKYQERALSDISTLAVEFQRILQDSSLVANNDTLKSSHQKLQLDIHTMKIDQSARDLLCLIRELKEDRVTSPEPYAADRADFQHQCANATETVKKCVLECYNQLTEIAEEGFSVRQSASKFLH